MARRTHAMLLAALAPLLAGAWLLAPSCGAGTTDSKGTGTASSAATGTRTGAPGGGTGLGSGSGTGTNAGGGASGLTCDSKGRLFPEGSNVPGDDCNSCGCSCDEGQGCGIACTELGCPEDQAAPPAKGSTIYAPTGTGAPYKGIACDKPTVCLLDQPYLTACARYGGRAFDNGCCQFACTVSVTRQPAQDADEEACVEARQALISLRESLETEVTGESATRRRYSCAHDADCTTAPLFLGEPCPLVREVGAAAYAEIKQQIDEHAAIVDKACPRFEGSCPFKAPQVGVCQAGYCALRETTEAN